MQRVRVGISAGDPCGIGPEIIVRALRSRAVRSRIEPVVFGDASLKRALGASLRVVSELSPRDRAPGRPTRATGRAQFAYLTALIGAAQRGEIDAMCTAPVSKEQIARAGIPFVGHTEVLAEAFGVDVVMLMDGPQLRVALATNHLPLREVPKALKRKKLVAQLQLIDRELTTLLRARPRIAVCGLNPHAGDGGLLGSEEERVIVPAIDHARTAFGIRCEGPFAADGLFAHAERFPYDVALAMFHDQGLVATKTFDFDRTVNVTLGLPIVRTSPDHGVAYDIAGKHRADETPMISALLKSAAYAVRRRETSSRTRS